MRKQSRHDVDQWLLERDERFDRYSKCSENWPQILDALDAAGTDIGDGLHADFTPLDVAISMAAALIRCNPSPDATRKALSFVRDNRLASKELDKDLTTLEEWNAARNR